MNEIDFFIILFSYFQGSVAIYVANTPVCILESGGMFGCFSKAGVTRQTLTATTKIHSTVLTVDSSLFHKTLVSFPKVMERMNRANMLNYEYLQETKESQHLLKDVTVEMSCGLYDDYKKFFDKLYINEDGAG